MTTTISTTIPTVSDLPAKFQQERRGHEFYPPSNIVLAVGTPLADVVIGAHYFIGSWDWWIAELDLTAGHRLGILLLGRPVLRRVGKH